MTVSRDAVPAAAVPPNRFDRRTPLHGNAEHLKLADLAHPAIVTDERMIDQTPRSQRVRGNAAKAAARPVMKFLLTDEDEPPASRVPNAARRRIDRRLPHLGLLVLDSPLVTYGQLRGGTRQTWLPRSTTASTGTSSTHRGRRSSWRTRRRPPTSSSRPTW